MLSVYVVNPECSGIIDYEQVIIMVSVARMGKLVSKVNRCTE